MTIDNNKYLAMFLQEVRENLAELNKLMVQLEKEPDNTAILQEILRLSHSSKSIAAAVEYQSTSDLFHALEDVFDAARNGKLAVTSDLTDTCFAAFDHIEASLNSIKKQQKELDCTEITTKILEASKATDGKTVEKHVSSEQKMEEDFMEHNFNHIRVSTSKIDAITNLAGELTMFKQQMRTMTKSLTVERLFEDLERLVDELNFQAIDMRLVSLNQAFVRFPRLVRDLARKQGKEIRLEMEGIDIELDKTLVDHLSAPMLHLIRNAVDHGIESPEDRKKAKKNAEGTIRIKVERKEGFARVTVEDDGALIDTEKIKQKAMEHGFAKDRIEAVTEETVLDLLCDPQFSSKDDVSKVSGRGVGLSSVLENVSALGGQLSLNQEEGIKRFTLSLPLQLSIIQALLLEVSGQTYALPLVHVKRLISIPTSDIQMTLGQIATAIDGEDVPLINLNTIFSKEDTKKLR